MLWTHCEFIEGGYQQTEAYNPYFTDILIYSPGILAIEPGCDRDSLLFALNPGAEVLCNNNLESLELIRPHPSGGRGFLHLNLWYTEHYVLRGSRTGLNTIWNQLFIHTPHSLFLWGAKLLLSMLMGLDVWAADRIASSSSLSISSLRR